MKNNHKLIFLFLFFIFLLSAGCAHNKKISVTPMDIESNNPTTPLSVVLLLNPDDCNYSHLGNIGLDEYKFLLGSSFCDYSEKIIKQIYSEVYIVSEMDQRANIDLIIAPKLVDLSFFWHPGFPVTVKTVIITEWQITDPNGELVAVKSIQGNGLDNRTFGFINARIQQSYQAAFDDLFNKVYTYLASSPEIKQLLK